LGEEQLLDLGNIKQYSEVSLVTFELIYKDFSVTHPVGDLPQLKLRFDLIGIVDSGLGIYIPNLLWAVSLGSTEAPDDPGMLDVGDWGEFNSISHVKISSKRKKVDVFCTIPMSSPKIMQLIDIRAHNKMPRLDINVKVNYHEFILEGNIWHLSSISSTPVKVKMHFKGSDIDNITFNTDEIIKLLEEIKQYELLRIEIPVKKEGKQTNKQLEEIVKILDIAKRDLIEGNYDGVLKSVRDSLTNKILEWNTENRQWILNKNIVKSFLENAPINAKGEYTELLKRVGNEFQSQLRIINDVYMHKDKTRVYPRPEDAEQILFITAYLVRYLSQTCISN